MSEEVVQGVAQEVARCPYCGTITGGTAAALDALYAEVARLRMLAERPSPGAGPDAGPGASPGAEQAREEAAAREAELLREIRLLQETVARLRGLRGSAAGSLRYGDLTFCIGARQLTGTFPRKGQALLEYRDIYAGGRLVGSASPDVITIVNPATEEVVGAVPAAVGVDVDRAVRSARRAFDDGHWATCSPRERADALDRLAAALQARTEETARLVTAEMGMPIAYSRQHNAAAPCAILRYYATLARAMDTEETRTAVSFTGRTVVRHEPAGVAAVITSWNYPIMLAFSQLAPALAAGCTIVLKPAAATSLSAYILAEAFEAADFPPGVFNLVTGTHQTAGMLARHPGVDRVAFSGPAKQGRWIASICGAELKPASLELGGQSAAIVLDDADLSKAMASLGSLCFGNSGQTCFAMSRVLVPEQLYDEVVDAMTSQACGLVLGDPLAEDTTMGPLASSRRRGDVESRVRAGVTSGARVVAGGRRPASPVRGYFYEPTVLADVTPVMPIAQEEICGPVATVIRYADEAEAVALANDGFGLAATVWTGDPQRGLDIARRTRVGTFGVNLYEPDIGSPWGGRGLSGQGSAYGPEGMDPYLTTKSVFLPSFR